MSDTDTPSDPSGLHPHQRFGLWVLIGLGMLAGALGLLALVLSERTVTLPDWATARIEAQVNAGLSPLVLRLDRVGVSLSRNESPQVHLGGVTLTDAAGRQVLRLPRADARLDGRALLQRRLEVSNLALTGADLTLRRGADGVIDLALGGTGAPFSLGGSVAEVLDEIDRAFDTPALAPLRAVSVEGLALTYVDARAGRTWRVENGLMTLDQTAETVAVQAFFSLRGSAPVASEFAFGFTSSKGSPAARFSASFSDVPSADIATQSPALAPLRLIEAPISGAIRSQIDAAGKIGDLSASLEIGQGALTPPGGAVPIRFDSAQSYFTYNAQSGRIELGRLSLDTSALRLSGEGHADLVAREGGWPEAVVAQVRFSEVGLDPDGVFERPAAFTGGALDIKFQLDPFEARIGQLVLMDGDAAYRASGRVRALPEGWDVAMSADLDRVDYRRLLALWPVTVAKGARHWLDRALSAGELYDAHLGLRRPPDGTVRAALGARIRGAEVKFLPEMPPLQGGRGYLAIDDRTLTVSVEGGTVEAPEGGTVDVAGSTLQVPDVTEDPARAVFRLKTDGTIPAALALTDLPPVRLGARVTLPEDPAEGRARLSAELRLPLIRDLPLTEIGYRVEGVLSDVVSDTLVPGRRLEAAALEFRADEDAVSIAGEAALDGVPLRAAWTRPTGAGAASQVTGSVELSQRANAAFGLGLPDDSLSGAARGAFALTLAPDAPPALTLTSDLAGLGLRLDALRWSKAPDRTGRLELAAVLGETPSVESLSFEAPGLSAEGDITLKPGGGLDVARFSRVRLGGWLDASVTLTGQGAGKAPAVAITGGTADLAGAPIGGGAGAGSGAIAVALDRVRVGDGIELTRVRGQVNGASGQVTGLVAGAAPIEATLVPARAGMAVRVRASDAGAVLGAAGIYRRASGGTLDLVLNPAGKPGHYDGTAHIENLRVGGTPVTVELLSAISVVGLLELLDGDGLAFTNVEAQFRLVPGAVEIREGSAVGPSLGVSLQGVYLTGSKRMDFRGVLSPVYMFNGIGSVLTRKGEGLLGFNFSLKGNPADPEVGVNPLSILTPGMFRELFRRPAPTLKETP
ncbi:hypothetical protein BYZ73_00275 [Rhodovulum viride]|uniref:YhdP central domain-containing protein n=1 Tax=Rhodovulum viride TaxID=1231134 RepID=A0ABX9DN76_9RHOB|nr:AsmA-like C-terminal region-containing protein [Rhodovulum viride]RAP43184.1 hypothetical protein BYZ73_00275 [Rhodovulum viride]